MRKVVTKVYTFQELLDLYEKKKIKESVLERVRQWLGDANTDDNWYEYDYELWEKALESIGLMDPKIQFSGFWSQGDGASFTADWIDKEKLIRFFASDTDKSEKIECVDGVEQFWPWLVHQADGYHRNPNFLKLLYVQDYMEIGIVRGTSNYSHEKTCYVEFEFRDDGEWVSKKNPDNPYWEKDSVWKSKYPRLRKLADDFKEAVEQLRLDLSKAIYKCLESSYEGLRSDESLKDLAEANDYTFTIEGSRFG